MDSLELKKWCDEKDYYKIADLFTNLAGSQEDARQLLVQVVNSYGDGAGNSRKRPAPSSSASPSSTQTPRALVTTESFYVRDSMDDMIITSLLQIPNDPAVIGSIIGPQGKSIKLITESTGCVVNLDQKSESAKARVAPITVFLQGSLRSVVKAAELLSLKLETLIGEWTGGTAQWSTTGCGINRTVMIIPDPLVKRVIGKGGATVMKLQRDAGVEVQMQNEAKMLAAPDPLFGREALLTGSLESRLHGMYLICRMLLDDKECPPAWRTLNSFPVPLRNGAMSGGMMTSKGTFSNTPPIPPPPQSHQHANAYHYNSQPGPPRFPPQQMSGVGGPPPFGLHQPNVHSSQTHSQHNTMPFASLQGTQRQAMHMTGGRPMPLNMSHNKHSHQK